MNRPRRNLIATLALAGSLHACSQPDRRDATMDAQDASDEGSLAGVEVTLGTGQEDFEYLPVTGAQVELIFGPQGGYHVWGRARFRGFAPDVDVTFTATRLDDAVVLHQPASLHRWIAMSVEHGLVELGGGDFTTNAEQVVLAIHCSDEVVGRTLRLDLVVSERATGRSAVDSRVVTVVDNDPSPPCASRD